MRWTLSIQNMLPPGVKYDNGTFSTYRVVFFSGIKTPCMQGFSMFDYDGGSKHDLWLFILAM